MRLIQAIPALPVVDVAQSAAFYRDVLGFTLIHHDTGFAIVRRDGVELHLWEASDQRWKERGALPPIVSGAESFIAGTASCRVMVEELDGLHAELEPRGILHPNAQLQDQPWGTREFGVCDLDNNLITFFERR